MEKAISFANIPLRIAVSEFKYKSAHYHPDVLELLFVIDGGIAVTIENRSVLLEPGQFLVINPGQIHTINCKRISTGVSIYFDLDNYSKALPYIRGVRYSVDFNRLRASQRHYWYELRNYFIRMMLMHNKNTRQAQKIMHDLGDKMIWLLWERFQRRGFIPEHMLNRYYSISAYLQENYKYEVSVAKVAQHENISVTRLAHFWKDTAGCSIRQSITRLRLEEAERMLLETPMTINDIAFHCGFSDEKYFYQHFKARYKTTPNEYRVRCLETQKQTVRVMLSRRESEQLFFHYAMKFYMTDIEPSAPPQEEEEIQKEAVLAHLYNAILANPHTLVKQIETTGQTVNYLQIAPNKALYLRGDDYRINWEYVYAQMHIFLECGMSSNVLVDIDCMEGSKWVSLLNEFISELLTIWGKSVVETQDFIIHTKIIQMYTQCITLAEFLRENTPVTKVQAVFIL